MKAKWYETSGDYGDIVISTRIRLARNLAEYPFPERMSASQRRECENKIKETVLNNGAGISKRFKYLELGLMLVNSHRDVRISGLRGVERNILNAKYDCIIDGIYGIGLNKALSDDDIRLEIGRAHV